MFHFLEKLKRSFQRQMHRLSELGAALVRPIDRAFQVIGRALFTGSERFEDSMGSVGQLLTWPFRAIGRLSNTLAALLLPESFRRLLTAPFRGLGHLSRRLGPGLMHAAEAVNLDRPVLWFVWLLQPIWRPIAAIGGFFYAWGATRNYKQMLWGLPALLLLLPFGLVLAKTVVFGNVSVANQYRLAVKEALERKDYDQAQLYERKLAQLGVDTKLTDYRTAEAFARDGKLAEAYERMQRLAPVDEPGYLAAHFWILQRMLSGEFEASEDESLRLSGIHLQHIKTLGYMGPETQLMRAYWLTQKNQLSEAADVLKPLVVQRLEAAVQRMQINLALKETDAAREDARTVRMHMQEHQRNHRQLKSQDYQWWAVAEEALGDVRRLKSVLQAWLDHEPENLPARQALANLYLQQFSKLLDSPRPNAKVLAQLLLEAADLSSDLSTLHKIANDLYHRQKQLPIVKEVIEQLVQSPKVPASICESLGTAAAASGNMVFAKTLLERTLALDASRATAWNNYAWVLSHGANKDLDRALDAVNRALDISPDEYRFRETRGQILLGRERWREAVADLEYAVNGLPENKEIHQSLASAYAALGEDELALVHRNQGKQ